MRALVTGGAGFIGSALIRRLAGAHAALLVLDKLGHGGDRDNLDGLLSPGHVDLVVADLADPAVDLAALLRAFRPEIVFHLAAETHVDRSIAGAEPFLQSNVVGTFRLLEASRTYRAEMPASDQARFRFIHVSTDEVFGALGADGAFDRSSPYAPRSPYSATKAASDHLARAWGHTYGLPVIVTNCGNNFGPRQFPEKLMPLVVSRALDGLPIPVYGKGEQVRDWLFVDDHADALVRVALNGLPGQTYLIGGGEERRNIDLVRTICAELDVLHPRSQSHEKLINFIDDRPGHDFRYALDCSATKLELGWKPAHDFADALRMTVRWYIENQDWWRRRLPAVDNRWRREEAPA